MSLTQMEFLPDGARLAIEFEAFQGSSDTRSVVPLDTPDAREMGCVGLVRVEDKFWLSGITAMQSDGSVIGGGFETEQETEIVARVTALLNAINSTPQDIMRVRFFTPTYYLSANGMPSVSPARLALMHPGHPGAAGITVSGLGDRKVGLLIEAEGIKGASETRKNVWDGRTALEENHYSRSVGVGDVVYVSGSTSLVPGEIVRSPFDPYGQTLNTLETVRWSIEQQGFKWGDLTRLRCYVVGEENIDLVASGLKQIVGCIRPAITVVGVPALGQPRVLVEIEATAIKRMVASK
jgi:enamine deaminase RidA (YjgF/YER057c/UK114 family)